MWPLDRLTFKTPHGIRLCSHPQPAQLTQRYRVEHTCNAIDVAVYRRATVRNSASSRHAVEIAARLALSFLLYLPLARRTGRLPATYQACFFYKSLSLN
jgi:hypothetical protein